MTIDVVRRIEFDAEDEIARNLIFLAYGAYNLMQKV